MNLVSRTTLMSLFMLRRAAISCLLIAGLASSMNTYAEGYSGTLNLKNADIREVVTQISAHYRKEFYYRPKGEGKCHRRLKYKDGQRHDLRIVP